MTTNMKTNLKALLDQFKTISLKRVSSENERRVIARQTREAFQELTRERGIWSFGKKFDFFFS